MYAIPASNTPMTYPTTHYAKHIAPVNSVKTWVEAAISSSQEYRQTQVQENLLQQITETLQPTRSAPTRLDPPQNAHLAAYARRIAEGHNVIQAQQTHLQTIRDRSHHEQQTPRDRGTVNDAMPAFQNAVDALESKRDRLLRIQTQLEDQQAMLAHETRRHQALSDTDKTIASETRYVQEKIDYCNSQIENHRSEVVAKRIFKDHVIQEKQEVVNQFNELRRELQEIMDRYKVSVATICDTAQKTLDKTVADIHHATQRDVGNALTTIQNQNDETLASVKDQYDRFVTTLTSEANTLTTQHRKTHDEALTAIRRAIATRETEVQTAQRTILAEVERDVFESYRNFVKNSTFYIRSSGNEDLYSPSWDRLRFDSDSKYAMTWTPGTHRDNGVWRLIHKREHIFKIQCTNDGYYLHSPKHPPLRHREYRDAMTYRHAYPGGGENEVLWKLIRCGNNQFYIQNLDSGGYLNYFSTTYDHQRRKTCVHHTLQNWWSILET